MPATAAHAGTSPGGGPAAIPITAEILRALSPDGRRRVIESFSPEQRETLKYWWELWARPNQLTPPGDWLIWLILAGRGFGKTRTLAEKVRERQQAGVGRIGLIGPTSDDVRAVMVEGESGILACSPPWNKPKYEPSKRRIVWPNGAQGFLYSADEPDRLRGPQHGFLAMDELAAWKYPEAFDMAMFGLRLGLNPQAVIATTPRPTPIVRDLVKRADPRQVAVPDVVLTSGSTYENQANLPKAFMSTVLSKYEGTRLGRQEIHAHLLNDTPGALWTSTILEDGRVRPIDHYADGSPIFPGRVSLKRVAIGVDPAGSIADMARIAEGLAPRMGGSQGDECGIVAAGLGDDDEGYVLRDATTDGSPLTWGNAAVDLYIELGADALYLEYNHGGEAAEGVLLKCADRRGVPLNVQRVWASRGKYTRAEPISALYEQGRVHHADSADRLAKLEDEMTTFVPGKASPNRLDAAVFVLTGLMFGPMDPGGVAVGGPRREDVPIFGGRD